MRGEDRGAGRKTARPPEDDPPLSRDAPSAGVKLQRFQVSAARAERGRHPNALECGLPDEAQAAIVERQRGRHPRRLQRAGRRRRQLRLARQRAHAGQERAHEADVEVPSREVGLDSIAALAIERRGSVEPPARKLLQREPRLHAARVALRGSAHLAELHVVDRPVGNGDVRAARRPPHGSRDFDRAFELAVDALELVGEVGQRLEREARDGHRRVDGEPGQIAAGDQPPQVDWRASAHREHACLSDQELAVDANLARLGVDLDRAAEPGHRLQRRIAAEPGNVAIHDVANVEDAAGVGMIDVAGRGEIDGRGSAGDPRARQHAFDGGQGLQANLVALEMHGDVAARGELGRSPARDDHRHASVQMQLRASVRHLRVEMDVRPPARERPGEAQVGGGEPAHRCARELHVDAAERVASRGRQSIRAADDGLPVNRAPAPLMARCWTATSSPAR